MTSADLVPIRRGLLSVSDKAGLVELGRALAEAGAEILSTGGTARGLREAGIPAREVSEVTGFPEILDGRVKTLHPRIHGGILARRKDLVHRSAVKAHELPLIDLVVVDLYPFEATLASGADRAGMIEMIDIGGPALIRSAAKNHEHVAVLTDPEQYPELIDALKTEGGTRLALRRRLASAAFARTASYDAAIAAWAAQEEGELFPKRIVLAGRLGQRLRYGENPHQRAALYRMGDRRIGVAGAMQLQGKELSYNNLNDTDAALELAAEFEEPAVVIVKHANPCGVAVAQDMLSAWRRALACDPVSAYGGIVALNRQLDGPTAAALSELFLEVVIAPGADADARAALRPKRNLRLLVTEAMPDPQAAGLTFRSLAGGLLVQERDGGRLTEGDLKVVTRRAPTPVERADLLFAFRVAKHVKSNAIVYAKEGATVGIGAGQMSRIDAARIAVMKAADARRDVGESRPRTEGAVVASDAFFPFADGLIAAAEAGVTAVIQPGGSLRDQEVIEAADARGLAMVFTGLRHFRH
ncbi:MAG TPA: bifunctional phosphoribosylaminoimidazolecarboxamide formyltransferase/IMP cyclohydrolase [Alphaproteobacteria bacterium]|nr:bifunctional phosphoribosylaminoimidazolecarboxamide formyltransferase/IMP cyclohydrolase [Alphaproteobacteria bacterium]